MWVKVAQSCPTLGDSMDSPWNSPGQNTGVSKSFPSPGDLPNPGIEPRSSALQADSLSAEPQGKPERMLRCEECSYKRVLRKKVKKRRAVTGCWIGLIWAAAPYRATGKG